MTLLMTLNTQLDGVTQALNRAQQDKTYAESLLSSQLQAWQSGEAVSGTQTLDQQLASAQSALNMLESRYTPDHPDVVKARQVVADLQKKMEAAAQGGKSPETAKKRAGLEPQSIQQLRNSLHGLDNEIRLRTAQQAKLQKQIAEYQAKVAAAPMVEEEGKSLARDYSIALAFYNDLLAKKTQSEMAGDMERRQQGETFRVMDPANLPEKPSFPDRTIFGVSGGLAGIGLGLVLAFLVELRDKSLRSDSDIEFYLELPTLAMVPVVGPEKRHPGDKRHWWQRRKKAPAQPEKAAVVAAATAVGEGVEA